MNTLIAYASRYGCTELCAKMLAERIPGEVVLLNLNESREPDLTTFDQVIIGGSIRIGRIQKVVKQFCAKHLMQLTKMKTGLFICCGRDGAEAEHELIYAFPDELLMSAVVKDYFGGEYRVSKMGFMDRWIVKRIVHVEQDTSFLKMDRIEQFARIMS